MKLMISALAIAYASAVLPSTSYAASQDECAIWICLPGGFPSGCGAAHSAMKKRLKKFKPPVPALHECLVSGPIGSSSNNDTGNTTARYENAQYWSGLRSGFMDGRCPTSDEYAIHSCRNSSKVSIFIDGVKYGKSMYWTPGGRQIEVK